MDLDVRKTEAQGEGAVAEPPFDDRLALFNQQDYENLKRELKKLEAKSQEKGYSIIPIRIFFSEKGLAKIEIGLGKGKKHFDKRNTIKERESDREIKRKYGV